MPRCDQAHAYECSADLHALCAGEAENAAGARARAKARGTERGRYQFEATGSDDEVEDEIDNNLDEIGGLAGRLKMLAMTAGQEVDAQNAKLGKLGNKVDVLDNNVVRSTNRLARGKSARPVRCAGCRLVADRSHSLGYSQVKPAGLVLALLSPPLFVAGYAAPCITHSLDRSLHQSLCVSSLTIVHCCVSEI